MKRAPATPAQCRGFLYERGRAVAGAWVCLLVSVLMTAASPARAAWTEVSSDHFVIYGDQKPETLRRFSERLELFHAAMSHLFKRPAVRPSPSNRVTVYIVPDARDVRDLIGGNQRFVQGAYLPFAGHPTALIPTLSHVKSAYGNMSEITLFHEYAHHFMFGVTSRAYPRWFVEGFAEFFSSVEITDTSVGLGIPAKHRSLDFRYAREVPIRTMLDYDGGYKPDTRRYDAFYAQSWALLHHLVFLRPAQLSDYQQRLAQGQTALQAAEGAFGNLDQLEKDLDRYVGSRQMKYFSIPRAELALGSIRVRVLPEGEAAVMPARIRSRTGISSKAEGEWVVAEIRKIAARYPGDAAVQSALSEAEFDTDNLDATIAAADRALAIDGTQINAWIQKGYALVAQAKANPAAKDSWNAVRNHWLRANNVESDNPLPLLGYYQAFLGQGVAPTPAAIRGLERAMSLAPFDGDLRWTVAQQMVSDGRLALAATTLGPLAYSPHPADLTEAARKLLEEVTAKIAAGTAEPAQVGSAQ